MADAKKPYSATIELTREERRLFAEVAVSHCCSFADAFRLAAFTGCAALLPDFARQAQAAADAIPRG